MPYFFNHPRYEYLFSGLSASGFSGTWIESDKHICQKFVSQIENKRFMWEGLVREDYSHVFASTQNLRDIAVATQDGPSSPGARRRIKEVGVACKSFATAYGKLKDESLELSFLSLRAVIGRNTAALVGRYELDFGEDLGPFEEAASELIQQWIKEEKIFGTS